MKANRYVCSSFLQNSIALISCADNKTDAALPPSYLAPQLYPVSLMAFLAYVVYILFVSPLTGVPGPFGASLSRLWLIQHPGAMRPG
jgi:hypothetical protein